jgi:hypothetical protein
MITYQGGESGRGTVEVVGTHKLLVEKFERKRPAGRPRRIWEGNIKIDIKIRYEDVNCT